MMVGVDRVLGRAIAAGVAGAGEAEIIGREYMGDMATGVQQAHDHGGIAVRRVIPEQA